MTEALARLARVMLGTIRWARDNAALAFVSGALFVVTVALLAARLVGVES